MTREEILAKIESLQVERNKVYSLYFEAKQGCNKTMDASAILSCWNDACLYWDEVRKIEKLIVKLEKSIKNNDKRRN